MNLQALISLLTFATAALGIASVLAERTIVRQASRIRQRTTQLLRTASIVRISYVTVFGALFAVMGYANPVALVFLTYVLVPGLLLILTNVDFATHRSWLFSAIPVVAVPLAVANSGNLHFPLASLAAVVLAAVSYFLAYRLRSRQGLLAVRK